MESWNLKAEIEYDNRLENIVYNSDVCLFRCIYIFQSIEGQFHICVTLKCPTPTGLELKMGFYFLVATPSADSPMDQCL